MNDDGKTIAFVLSAGLTPLDFIGPPQVMSGLEVVEATFGMQPRHHVVVVAEDLDPVPTDTPVQVAATTTLSTGSLLLAGAGLPHGRPATTHWVYHRFLERLGGDLRAAARGRGRPLPHWCGSFRRDRHRSATRAILTSDDVARTIQLAIEYDPQPPHGGIDWRHVDRDSFGPRVEGFAHQALDDHPDLLARLVGSEPQS